MLESDAFEAVGKGLDLSLCRRLCLPSAKLHVRVANQLLMTPLNRTTWRSPATLTVMIQLHGPGRGA